MFNFFATLGGYFASLIVDAGKAIIVAILGWDVYTALVNAFSKGIEWVVGKITWMVDKVKAGIEAMKEFLGLGEKVKTLDAETVRKAGVAGAALGGVGGIGGAAPAAPAKPLAARNNVSANSNTTVNINVSNTTVNINVSGGGDNKALAAQIGKEVRGALATERRRQGGNHRSAFYDTDAALA